MKTSSENTYQNWIIALRAGDSSAFEKLYQEFWESLFAIAFNRLKSRESVEEILQELFTDLWVRRERLEVKTSVAAYLHAALKYKILNHIHAQNLRRTYSQDHPQYIQTKDDHTREILAFEELHDSLARGLEKLPEKCRLIFKKSREEQKTSIEIAKELNISHRTVQTHIHNAIKFLKGELSDYKYFIMFFLLSS